MVILLYWGLVLDVYLIQVKSGIPKGKHTMVFYFLQSDKRPRYGPSQPVCIRMLCLRKKVCTEVFYKINYYNYSEIRFVLLLPIDITGIVNQ